MNLQGNRFGRLGAFRIQQQSTQVSIQPFVAALGSFVVHHKRHEPVQEVVEKGSDCLRSLGVIAGLLAD